MKGRDRMNLFMGDMPLFIKRELEKLNETIAPLAKKASKYALWSLPLISVSVVNLIFLLFFMPESSNVVSLVVFAVLGAVGFALSKEAKYHKKEIHKQSRDYMIKRITSSDAAPEHSKDKYVALVKGQPVQAMQHFVKFLEEENRMDTIY